MTMPGPPKTADSTGTPAALSSTESTATSSSPARRESSDPQAEARQHSNEADRAGADVILHIYQCDQWTGFLNKWWLKDSEMPIYHLGVEVHGEEWSFLYFEDCWDDESVSGVIRCQPKSMTDYQYLESINLGPTTLTEDEADDILLRLHYEYPACSYHLTRRNCLTFAEDLVRQLRPPKPYPPVLKGIVDAASQAPRIDATVDYGWSWAKWYMVRKHSQPASGVAGEPAAGAGYLCCAATGADQQASMWSLLLQPGNACSGKMCPAPAENRAKIDGVDELRGTVSPSRDDFSGSGIQSHIDLH